MMEKDKLRKADIFSGAVVVIFGLWIVSQALRMPMKDSWGGVQNVWFVSPALFPLFVGSMIVLLGILLIRTAFKSVGYHGFAASVRWLTGPGLVAFLKSNATFRFYAVVILFVSFIYLYIPRVDFFLCSVLFLVVFITGFYLDDAAILRKVIVFYLVGVLAFGAYFALGLDPVLTRFVPFAADVLTLCFISAYCFFAWMLVRGDSVLRKKYRTALIVAVATPFILGPIFKYFLLVPMPSEGLVVAVMDYFWYLVF